jgi:hypothetical protein
MNWSLARSVYFTTDATEKVGKRLGADNSRNISIALREIRPIARSGIPVRGETAAL